MVQDPNKNPYDDCWFRNCFHRDTDASAAKRPRANRESSSASSAAAAVAAEESSTSDDEQGWFNVSCHHHHAQPSAAGSSSAAAEEESTSGHHDGHAPSCDHQQVIRVVQQPQTSVPDVQMFCPSQPLCQKPPKAGQILALIGREHGGPATTLGDGNCCMHACMGENLSKEVIMELRENVTRIMNECPLLRQEVLNSERETHLQKMKVGSGHVLTSGA